MQKTNNNRKTRPIENVPDLLEMFRRCWKAFISKDHLHLYAVEDVDKNDALFILDQ